MSTTPEHILEKIQEAKAQGLKRLDLFQRDLETIPEEVFALENIEELDLRFNQLMFVPESISKLQNLTYLDLRYNQFFEFPKIVTALKNLKVLLLGHNKLEIIPDEIENLLNLESLGLAANKLLKISEGIFKLKRLKKLSLGVNFLTEVPKEIIQLTDLTHLYLEGNRLKELPHEIIQLQNLKELQLYKNPIEKPPREIFVQGIEAIRNYFKQVRAQGYTPLYEAKLLIIGEGGAGKTTLRKKIINPSYQLCDDEVSTEGIEVMQWEFPKEGGKPFRVNIWDFGGQEIYHSTHQFFLTKRSLYVLVADTRKEDTDFYYWLNVIEMLSDNSPLLIIKNEKQDRHREINERQLRGQFSNIKETLAANLATNRGLPEILDEIKHYICHLPHIGSELPKTWVSVRDALENESRNYITLEEYLNICERHGIKDRNFKLQLSGYLHDLGVCLHFQDDPLLKKTVILKPSWGTTAVYKALDNKTVIHNLGQFTKADLASIWYEDTYANMHDELLQLMINFKLCYQIPNSRDTYIAPQLLTENQPTYDWDDNNNLILRYTYEFMPKGILTRFIVAMHHAIADQRSVWKTGVILGKDETLAEVIEYYDRREIKIRIAGKHKKELLTIVMYELDKIHDAYNRLKYSKLIPCHCEQCKPSQEPHFYPFEILRKFIADRQAHIQCPKSYRMVNVRALIDDVMGKDAISPDAAKPFGGERRKQQELKNLEAQWELVNAKLSKLATAFVLATQAAEKFQLEQQIEEVKKEKAAIEAQLQALE